MHEIPRSVSHRPGNWTNLAVLFYSSAPKFIPGVVMFGPKNSAFRNSFSVPYHVALKLGLKVNSTDRPAPSPLTTTAPAPAIRFSVAGCT